MLIVETKVCLIIVQIPVNKIITKQSISRSYAIECS